MSQCSTINIVGSNPQIPTDFIANIGAAIPIANTLEILGDTVPAGVLPVYTSGAGNTITTNVQISQAIASSNALNVGLAAFDSSAFSVDANGFVTFTGSLDAGTITGNSGGPLSQTADNWNIIGQVANTTPVMYTIGSGSTLSIEDRTWQTQYVVDPSSTSGLRGTFTTIQSAINQAVADGVTATRVKTIRIRPGTYLESLVMPANSIHLTGNTPSGYLESQSGPLFDVNIDGMVTFATGAVAHFSNLNFSNSVGATVISLANTTNVCHFYRCNVLGTDSVFKSIDITAGSSMFSFEESWIPAGDFSLSSGTAYIRNSLINAFSNTGGTLDIQNSRIDATSSTSTVGETFIINCTVRADLSVGASTTLTILDSIVQSSSSNCITGAGTINFGNVTFNGSGSTITTTTQIPRVSSNDAIKITTPGAYPYTTVPQDRVILVDTSSARTITPLASPTTGQRHTIKDNVGSATANNITITPSGKNIDGGASATININYGSMDIVYNGTQWNII